MVHVSVPSQEAAFHRGSRGNIKAGEGAKWRTNSKAVRRNSGIAEGTMPPNKQLRGLSRTDRILDLVQLAFDWCKHSNGDIDELFVDCSQDVGHRPWTVSSVRSLTTSSEIYASGIDRVILAGEHMRLLGFGRVNVDSFSSRQLRELSGEAMSPPCVALCLLSIFQVLLEDELAGQGQQK